MTVLHRKDINYHSCFSDTIVIDSLNMIEFQDYISI